MRKNIDLPETVVKDLIQKAFISNYKVKPYMEVILTTHSKKKKESDVWVYLCKTLKKAGVNDNNYTARKIHDYLNKK